MKNSFVSFFILIGIILTSVSSITLAGDINLKMVFVPASEKGDDQDYIGLIKISVFEE